MKLAITAQDNTMNSKIDPRFGRCKWFIVVDTTTGENRPVCNEQNLNAA